MSLNINKERLNELERFSKNELDTFVTEVTNICEIPSPSDHEEKRAKYVAKRLSDFGFEVEVDEVHNVIAYKKGNTEKKPNLMFAAHTDTVFPPGTDVSVTREGDQLFA